ncbi:MAG: hypothetical protein MZV64_02750 [Ignavibacteriales bacterium]|nr:hypothetical protein [Ignavibacteriales bacterium]
MGIPIGNKQPAADGSGAFCGADRAFGPDPDSRHDRAFHAADAVCISFRHRSGPKVWNGQSACFPGGRPSGFARIHGWIGSGRGQHADIRIPRVVSAAAWLAGRMTERSGKPDRLFRTALLLAPCWAVILFPGSLYLYASFKWWLGREISLSGALVAGGLVFIPAEILKTFLRR